MVGIGVSSGTPGLVVNMLGVGTGYTAPAAIFNGGNVGINLGIGASTPGSTLSVGGNVGIGRTSANYALGVAGNVGIGQSLLVGSALQLSGYACNGLSNGG